MHPRIVFKQSLRGIVEKSLTAGYRALFRAPKGFAINIPQATYAPWTTDLKFMETYKRVKRRTLVDIYKCYALWQMVQDSAKLYEGAIIEVGVWRGGTGAILAKAAECAGIVEPVYLCDTFKGIVKSGPCDNFFNDGALADCSRKDVEELLLNIGAKNVTILEGVFPDDTAQTICDSSVRFCHIDVDVYTSAKDIIEWLEPRLVAGAFIVFDDYGSPACNGIRKLVHELQSKQEFSIFHNLNGQAVLVRRC